MHSGVLLVYHISILAAEKQNGGMNAPQGNGSLTPPKTLPFLPDNGNGPRQTNVEPAYKTNHYAL